MTEQPQSIRVLYHSAERRSKDLETAPNTSDAGFQERLSAAIAEFEECLRLIDRVALFSPNETLDDVASGDLVYFQIHFQLAGLLLKITQGDRRTVLRQARLEYESYLKLIDAYDILSSADAKTFQRYLEDPNNFSEASGSDAAARRQAKISRFQEEKAITRKLEYLAQNPATFQADESVLRDLHLTKLALCTHQAFHQLDLIAQELRILALAPPSSPQSLPEPSADQRDRDVRGPSAYSERLDSPTTNLRGRDGPILSRDGKPLRPFTLLPDRQRFQEGVFRPDHSLPTMTIDEYLEEERRRGGIIEGGGPASAVRPEPDEDNMAKADEETMKARAWDEFTEANPKGSGNTLNRG